MEKELRQASNEPSGTGYLIVRVATAGGSIPLEGARIDIRTYPTEETSDPQKRDDTVASLISGADGNTARIPLSAPQKALSESPGNGRPYSLYQAEATLEGYGTQTFSGIPIFDGITSVQPVILIPLPENGSPSPRRDGNVYFEGMSPNL